MRGSLTSFTAAATLVVLSSIVGCGGPTDSDPAVMGTGTGGTGTGTGGSAQGTGGSAPGTPGTGSAGMSSSGTGGTGSGAASAIPATFDTVKLVLMGGGPIMPCAAAPCHGVHGMAPPGAPLELPPNDDAQLYTNLTSYIAKDCSNTKLVTPGDPAHSAILTILQGPCGMVPRMPYMCTDADGNCIPAEYVTAISRWIASGAPQR